MGDLFKELMKEKNDIALKHLLGGDVKFERLRELAKEFSESHNVDLIVDGSDQELWKSVVDYFENMR